jgi:hypothetical protein
MSLTDIGPASVEAIRQEFLEAERAKWLTVEESAYVLSTSKNILLRMIHGGLPIRREGKVIRIHVDDLRPQRQEVQP